MPFPPLNVTKSAPSEINFFKFPDGGISAAASTITGILYLCANSMTLLKLIGCL